MAAFAGVVTLLAGVIVSEGLLLLIVACVLVKMASHGTLQARTHTYIHTNTLRKRQFGPHSQIHSLCK